MKALMITMIIVVCVMTYATVAGFVGTRFYRWRTNACKDCNSEYGYCSSLHNEPAVFAGLLWPLLAPILAGHWSASRDKRADRLQVEIDRLERELGMNQGGAR